MMDERKDAQTKKLWEELRSQSTYLNDGRMEGRTDARTDRRTDGRTDGHGQGLMPFHILRIAGAYWDKIVGGVALTRYLMSISFCSNLAQK